MMKRKNKKNVLKFRGAVRKREIPEVMMAEKLVQLAETLVVRGQPGVEQPVVATEFDTGNRFDLPLPAGGDKIHNPGGVVDIGQRQRFNATSHGLVRQFVNRQGSVTEGVAGVTGEVHRGGTGG